MGPYVARELVRRGHEVTVYSRTASHAALPDNVRRIDGSRSEIANRAEEFRRVAPAVVVDFILSSGRQAQALMDTFRDIAKRVVVLSSGDVYRAAGVLHGLESGPLQEMPLTEESEVRTKLNPYPPEVVQRLKTAFTWLDDEYDKIPVERVAMSDPQLPGTVLRLPMVYGPGDPLHRLFPYLKRMDDQRPAILLQADVAQWRGPRGYVENVAAAITLATLNENAAGEIYNVADRESASEIEWVRKIAGVVNWPGSIVTMPKESMPAHLRLPFNTAQHWIYSTAKIREKLGFSEAVDERTALERTVAWERQNPPTSLAAAQFDYAAEDRALQEVRRAGASY